MTPVPLALSMTRQTPPSAVMPACVPCVERVTLRAVSHRGVARSRAYSPEHILLMANRLQVAWPNTGGHAAEVVKLKLLRDRSNKEFVGETVCVDRPPLNREPAIATILLRSSPKPARPEVRSMSGNGAIPIDLCPKTGLGSWPWIVGAAVPHPAVVVHLAPATCEHPFLTSRDRTGSRLSSHREFTPHGVIGPDVCASRPFCILTQLALLLTGWTLREVWPW